MISVPGLTGACPAGERGEPAGHAPVYPGTLIMPSGLHRLEVLQRVRPVVVQEPGRAPQDAQRLDRDAQLDPADVDRLPAELREDLGGVALVAGVVAAD